MTGCDSLAPRGAPSDESGTCLKRKKLRPLETTSFSSLMSCVCALLDAIRIYLYQLLQVLINVLFTPLPPSAGAPKMGRVAVIGAGLTGLSSAAQLKSHGFDVTIFEERAREGGIWCDVNSTSNLQTSSIMYRFHPLVFYRSIYPCRDDILAQQRKVWNTYRLSDNARFNTRVTKVDRNKAGRWIINGNASETFDGLVVTVGTCGKPNMIPLPNQKSFRGEILHSSQLDEHDFEGKRVVVIGGGASGVEAAETALERGAKKATILARKDHWIIPRQLLVDCFITLFPYGSRWLAWLVPEQLIRRLHYRELDEKMSPTTPLYSGTPVVNNDFLRLVRQGAADYQRGETTLLHHDGIEYNFWTRNQSKDEQGETRFMSADMIVLATGFERPTIDFLPKDLFPSGYTRPNMYLQCFPVTDASVVCTNATYVNGIGSVGHFHIGLYVRLLALFLHRPETRPSPAGMRKWVDSLRYSKRHCTGGPLEFFAYGELFMWFFLRMLSPVRLVYIFFVLFGFGEWTQNKQGQAQYRYTIMDFVPRLITLLHSVPLESPRFPRM